MSTWQSCWRIFIISNISTDIWWLIDSTCLPCHMILLYTAKELKFDVRSRFIFHKWTHHHCMAQKPAIFLFFFWNWVMCLVRVGLYTTQTQYATKIFVFFFPLRFPWYMCSVQCLSASQSHSYPMKMWLPVQKTRMYIDHSARILSAQTHAYIYTYTNRLFNALRRVDRRRASYSVTV